MANLTEVVNYDAAVYQIATTDPVAGGPGGIANLQAQALANRTAWLYQQVESIINGGIAVAGGAPINSPIFTGQPQAPSPPLGSFNNQLATTAWVQETIGNVLAISVAGGSNVTLTSVQAGNGIFVFSGLLTANINVIVPAAPSRTWVVSNITSGPYTLTIKTPTGSGVAVTQNTTAQILSDGANIAHAVTDFPSVALTGIPSAPTASQFNYSQQLATCQFVQTALGNLSGVFYATQNVTLLPAYAGNMVVCNSTNAITVTLPNSQSVS